MATSSIFADFTIKDKRTAEAFVMALEESADHEKQQPPAHDQASLLTDRKAIRALMAKRSISK